MDKLLIKFLESQNASTITIKDGKKLWPFIVYYAFNENKLYFVSSKNTKHGKLISQKPMECAVSIVWHSTQNLEDRKAIQGQGKLKMLKTIPETLTGMQILDKRYPDWKFNLSEVAQFLLKKAIYEIELVYIKYWDDKNLGEDRTKEYIFTKKKINNV